MKYRSIALASLFVAVLFFVLPLAVQAADPPPKEGLIVCSGVEGDPKSIENPGLVPCTTCHFFALISKIINFLAVTIVPLIAVVLIAWGGVLYLTSGAVDKKDEAKKLIVSAVIGLVLIYASFLLLFTFLNIIVGNKDHVENYFKIKDNGFVIDCSILPPPPPPVCGNTKTEKGETCDDGNKKSGDGCSSSCQKESPSRGGGPGNSLSQTQGSVSTEMKSSAQNALALASHGVTFLAAGSCMGVSPKSTMQELAAGKQMTVCSAGCGPSSGCGAKDGKGGFITPSGDMLEAFGLIAVDAGPYQITSITGGAHSSDGSDHYKGKGLDIEPVPKTPANQLLYVQKIRSMPGVRTVRCELGSVDKTSQGCVGADHIHISFQ